MMGLAANRRLAGLLGWSNIIELGGALLGKPPAGMPESRGQALVPDWTGDWRACGPLMAEHLSSVSFLYGHTVANSEAGGASAAAKDHGGDRDAAARAAIVDAVIAALESPKR